MLNEKVGDLISRSALLEEFGEEPLVWDGRDREQVQERNDWEWHTGLVKAAHAVDAVIPVRCKDCKMRCPESISVVKHCTLTGIQTDDDDFCSYGERMAE